MPSNDLDKITCNACPVLCQISPARSGACDRYANVAGVLTRVDPLVLLQAGRPAVPFPHQSSDDWPAGLGGAEPVNLTLTGVGAGTTYPDYKPAPFIVASQHEGVDTVTVVTEGIFSYCSFRIKIDTDRWLGPEPWGTSPLMNTARNFFRLGACITSPQGLNERAKSPAI
jgi:6-hydroxynicotinate reductase